MVMGPGRRHCRTGPKWGVSFDPAGSRMAGDVAGSSQAVSVAGMADPAVDRAVAGIAAEDIHMS